MRNKKENTQKQDAHDNAFKQGKALQYTAMPNDPDLRERYMHGLRTTLNKLGITADTSRLSTPSALEGFVDFLYKESWLFDRNSLQALRNDPTRDQVYAQKLEERIRSYRKDYVENPEKAQEDTQRVEYVKGVETGIRARAMKVKRDVAALGIALLKNREHIELYACLIKEFNQYARTEGFTVEKAFRDYSGKYLCTRAEAEHCFDMFQVYPAIEAVVKAEFYLTTVQFLVHKSAEDNKALRRRLKQRLPFDLDRHLEEIRELKKDASTLMEFPLAYYQKRRDQACLEEEYELIPQIDEVISRTRQRYLEGVAIEERTIEEIPDELDEEEGRLIRSHLGPESKGQQ